MLTKKWQQISLFLLITILEFLMMESFFGMYFLKFSFLILVRNFIIYFLVNLFLLSLFHRLKTAMLVSVLTWLILGIANYFVTCFRGYGIVWMDFYAFKTALSVAANYSFSVDIYFWTGMSIGILNIVLCTLFPSKKEKYFRKKTISLGIVGLLCTTLCGVGIFHSDTFFYQVKTVMWDHQIGIQKSGYALYFLSNSRATTLTPPSGYSATKAEAILDRYTQSVQQNEKKQLPHLIMIMNESFSDLRVLDEKVQTREPVMPFFDRLQTNTIKGDLTSSVYGGYTSNTEFEFLTGSTKGFLPGNMYLQYMTQKLPTIVTDLKQRGAYEKVLAMHAYHGSGYNRNRVYPLLGFDEFITMDDMKHKKTIREYISDEENYREIIERYETHLKQNSDSPFCIFDVTMQNHSPYTYDWEPDEPMQFTSFPVNNEVNQYLSLMRCSDRAVENLISYFEKEEEPVVILLFGDHQPHLPEEFYQQLWGTDDDYEKRENILKKYQVPFFIWANYGIEEKTIENSSVNYLSNLLYEVLGLEKTPYQKFLDDVQKQIPTLCAAGYQTSLGYVGETSQPDGKSKEIINEYKLVQYYYLFDHENRKDKYFYSHNP